MNGRPVVFGEALFDRFPDGASVLGGAPFNVAWHLQGFGADPLFVSRVGGDEAGARVREAMGAWGMDMAGLQVDSERPTGVVEVTLAQGQPSFDILPERAYDYIDAGTAAEAAAAADPALVYHGTLIMRLEVSRHALESLRARVQRAVFLDVNLRDPWWCESDVETALAQARWLKVNEEELRRIARALDAPERTIEDNARALQARHELELVVVTCGAEGAAGFERRGPRHAVRPQGGVRVVDTVGAGDAFASVLLLGLLREWPLDRTLQRAQAFASQMCGIRGATSSDRALYRGTMAEWEDGG